MGHLQCTGVQKGGPFSGIGKEHVGIGYGVHVMEILARSLSEEDFIATL